MENPTSVPLSEATMDQILEEVARRHRSVVVGFVKQLKVTSAWEESLGENGSVRLTQFCGSYMECLGLAEELGQKLREATRANWVTRCDDEGKPKP